MRLLNLDYLKPFATERQLEFIEAVQVALGNVSKAERMLGVSQGLIARSIGGLKAKAARRGCIPELGLYHNTSEPVNVERASIHYKATPTSPQHWLKINFKEEQYKQSVVEAVREAIEDPYKVEPFEISHSDYDTQNVYWINIGDAHLNMIAYESATGADFNMEICERELKMAVQIAIERIPPCERIVLQDLGDFTHFENFKATTEHSGNQMDYDKPFPNMTKIYTKLTRFIIDLALTKAKYVDYIANQGNHSRTNDIWSAVYINDIYEKTDRVNVIDNSSPFIAYRQGKVLVLSHHGDKVKPARLSAIMAHDFRADWGETEYHYIDMGHVHTNNKGEAENGAVWESFNILAAKDKYAHDGGWRSRQCLTVLIRNKEFGEQGRWTIDIREVWTRLIEKFGEANIYVPKPKRAHLPFGETLACNSPATQ